MRRQCTSCANHMTSEEVAKFLSNLESKLCSAENQATKARQQVESQLLAASQAVKMASASSVRVYSKYFSIFPAMISARSAATR